MSEIFDKEKNNKNPVPNAEDKENAYIETDRDNKNSKEDNKTYSQSNENKKENKEADEFLYRQKGEKGDAEEAPSNAYQGNQADYEAEKDQKKAQNDQEEIQRTSDILNKKAKRNRTLGIGLIAVIVAIAIAITTLGGLFVMVAVDTAISVKEFVKQVLDGYEFNVVVGGSPNEDVLGGSGQLPENNGGTVEFEDVEFEIDTSETEGTLSISDVVKRTSDTVVLVTAFGYDRYGKPTSGTGSGVTITEDGYIVTNNHVVDGASYVSVTVPDKGEFEANVVGYDRSSDIALLHINTTGLAYATLGDSDDLVMGQEVVALGYPLGSAQTVTSGLVSALNVRVKVDGVVMSLIRTNAAINPGNSGGGLFDRSGRLIGIVNAKQVDTQIEGLGYAIPINTVVESIK